MKPLTIDELKSLEVGDWVWENKSKVYLFIKDKTNEYLLTLCDGVLDKEYFCDYGIKWLAYKNKEMAESKGEIVELPCIAMIEQGIVDGKFKSTKEAQQFNGRYAVVYKDDKKLHKPLIDICWSKSCTYDFYEAERRLAELKGE